AGFLPVAGMGEDLVGDVDALDDDLEVGGKALSFGAAGSCGVWLSLLRCGRCAAWLRRRRRFSQHDLVEEELELGRVELFAAGPEEPLLEPGDDLVLADEFGFEADDLGLQPGD